MELFNEKEWENISLMNDEDIDYSILPNVLLEKLALGNELYIATSALSELSTRDIIIAQRIALEILSTHHGDVYLRATAINILLGSNETIVWKYLPVHIADCNYSTLDNLIGQFYNDGNLIKVIENNILQTIKDRLNVLEKEQEGEEENQYVQELKTSISLLQQRIILSIAQQLPIADYYLNACWKLLINGIEVGWLYIENLIELQNCLHNNSDYGVEELCFEFLGDQLRVSFLDDKCFCKPHDFIQLLSHLIKAIQQ